MARGPRTLTTLGLKVPLHGPCSTDKVLLTGLMLPTVLHYKEVLSSEHMFLHSGELVLIKVEQT
jgi:hypothetical protein